MTHGGVCLLCSVYWQRLERHLLRNVPVSSCSLLSVANKSFCVRTEEHEFFQGLPYTIVLNSFLSDCKHVTYVVTMVSRFCRR